VSFSIHRAKRLTRLSGVVPLGTCEAILGRCALLLATIPLISAAPQDGMIDLKGLPW
jgi:hypothetical protein